MCLDFRSTSRFVIGLERKMGSKLWKSSRGVSTVSSTSTLGSGNDLLSCSQETITIRLFINELIVVLLVLNLAFQFIHIMYWNLQSSVFHSAPYTTIRFKTFFLHFCNLLCVSVSLARLKFVSEWILCRSARKKRLLVPWLSYTLCGKA